MDAKTIRENIDSVRHRIDAACKRSGRNSGEVILMAVTKIKPRSLADAAYEAGVRVFGENRVQEAEEKYREFFDDGELHLIGHLQSNKAKTAASLFSWVHSIDKIKTARALANKCREAGTEMNILLEINTSGEETKYGYAAFENALWDIDGMLELSSLKIRGLMTVGPFTTDEKSIRRSFRTLRNNFEEFKRRYPNIGLDTVSMGMSGDFVIAIEEGSTMVRLGSTIFGPRE